MLIETPIGGGPTTDAYAYPRKPLDQALSWVVGTCMLFPPRLDEFHLLFSFD